MSAFHIENQTIANNHYRHVIWTGENSQLVLMSLIPTEYIHNEIHPRTDQFIRIEKGTGRFTVNGVISILRDGDAICIPAGSTHMIENVGRETDLKLYTIYSGEIQHPPFLIQSDQPSED